MLAISAVAPNVATHQDRVNKLKEALPLNSFEGVLLSSTSGSSRPRQASISSSVQKHESSQLMVRRGEEKSTSQKHQSIGVYQSVVRPQRHSWWRTRLAAAFNKITICELSSLGSPAIRVEFYEFTAWCGRRTMTILSTAHRAIFFTIYIKCHSLGGHNTQHQTQPADARTHFM